MTSNSEHPDAGPGGLLDRDEVDFLLDSNEAAPKEQPQARASAADDAAEVTMRGDLDKINLTDIFQTLAMSKMEGMLCISTPIEKREVFFKDGFVRCLTSHRAETLRLGQRLVRAGHATADELRSALLEQKKSRVSLGQVLVDRGLIQASDVDDIVSNQLQEELFSLFTWRHGSFAFYKGPPTDAMTIERIGRAPEFDANGVLLEVARRADEWERVFDRLGSLDELFTTAEGLADGFELEGDLDTDDHARVLELADGTRNVRDLADAALLELFEAAILVRELVEHGLLEPAPLEAALATVDEVISGGDGRRAHLLLDALLARTEPLRSDQILTIAQLLGRCGERRRGAQFLCRAAEGCQDPEESLHRVRAARELDRRSTDVLRALLSALRAAPGDHDAEILSLRLELIDQLSEDGAHEDAIELLRGYESDTDDLDTTRPRLASAQARLGQTDEAVESLLGLAERLDEKSDKKRLTAVYEQVLRIDFRRKDIAKRVKQLHAKKLTQRSRRMAAAAVVIAGVLMGVAHYRDSAREDHLQALQQELRRLIPKGVELAGTATDPNAAERFEAFEAKLATATQRHATVTAEEGEHPLLDAVRQDLGIASKALNDARRAERAARSEQLSRDAEARLEACDLDGALRVWDAAISVLGNRDEIDNTIREKLYAQIESGRVATEELRGQLPGSPLESAPRADLEATLREIETKLTFPAERLIRALDAARDSDRISDLFDRDRETFEMRLGSVLEFLKQRDARRDQYRAALDDTRTAEELTPLYNRAREYERTYRFAEALEAYRQLAAEHPEEDELKERFRARVQRYASILRYLDLLARATADGDFASATGQLSLLRRQYPDIPFDDFVKLPVRVETQPAGAQVFLDGAPVGRAPLVSSYRPGVETRVRIELDGFHAEETVLKGDRIGMVRSLLARRSLWNHEPDSTIDQGLLIDRPRAQLIYSDRGGRIAAVDLRTGEPRWQLPTDDVSGLLTAPVQIVGNSGPRRSCVVGSVDGQLRAIDLGSGELLWQRSDLPCDAAPVAARDLVAVATLDGELVVLDAESGKDVERANLPGPVEADLTLIEDRLVLAVSVDGRATAIDLLDRSTRWSARVGVGVVAPPLKHGRSVIVISDDGRIHALDTATGESRWVRDDFAGLVVRPAAADGRLFVAEARTLHVLDLRTGRTTRSELYEHELRGSLTMTRGTLFCAESNGTVHALDAERLEPRFLLRAAGPALTGVASLSNGNFVVAFADRTLQMFGSSANGRR